MYTPKKPNIVFFFWDNLGWGEVGCYGGGILRGAPRPRIDSLATDGHRPYTPSGPGDYHPEEQIQIGAIIKHVTILSKVTDKLDVDFDAANPSS